MVEERVDLGRLTWDQDTSDYMAKSHQQQMELMSLLSTLTSTLYLFLEAAMGTNVREDPLILHFVFWVRDANQSLESGVREQSWLGKWK